MSSEVTILPVAYATN